MPNPVVHFEIQTKNAEQIRQFYSKLFGWKIDANNPMDYGMVDTGGQGINGGIGGAQGPNMVTFYVQTDDPQASLDKATSLGATVMMPVSKVTDDTTIALFADPDGNVVGLVKGM